MRQPIQTVVGIDVGGERKGFHAVALQGEHFIDKTTDTDPDVIVAWCLDYNVSVIAADSPCHWSESGSSRLAERELSKLGIWCFSSPTREKAMQLFYNSQKSQL